MSRTAPMFLGYLLVFGSILAPSIHAAEVRRTRVADEEFTADYLDTEGSEKSVAVLVLGGSEGGKPNNLASMFAEHGYPVLSLAYFKAPGRPDYLDEVPLEYFDKPIAWLAAQPGVKKIAVVGGSKGAELALLLASRKAELAGVIAIAPSSVVFQSIPKVFFPPRSSWTAGGEPLPFVPYDVSQGVDPKKLLSMYERSLEHEDAVAEAAIAVERIGGPILLLTGADDSMWPSSRMARDITDRLEEHKFPHAHRHIDYADAGHTLNEFFMLGGTREGNRKARLDARSQMLDFVAELDGEQAKE